STGSGEKTPTAAHSAFLRSQELLTASRKGRLSYSMIFQASHITRRLISRKSRQTAWLAGSLRAVSHRALTGMLSSFLRPLALPPPREVGTQH
ncbi:MAG: hypothetical protein KJ624_04945, partial [Chloroflexi bacterium]|nr:hypothetical protein [Chloroflexota bacterium]